MASLNQSTSSMEQSIPLNTALVHSSSSVSIILRLIAELTGLRFVCVGRMSDEQWSTFAVLDRLGLGQSAGDELHAAAMLCKGLPDQKAMVVTGKASQDDRFCNHPARYLYRIESWISIPLCVEGKCFGVLCALDPVPDKTSDRKILSVMEQFADLICLQIEADNKLQDSVAAAREYRDEIPKEQSFDALSHDFYPALASIVSGTDALLAKPLDKDARAVVERMRKSGQRLTSAIRKAMLSVFSRLERRHEFLLRLQEGLHGLAQPHSIGAYGTKMLGQYLDVDRCGYVETEEESGGSARLVHEWNSGRGSAESQRGEDDMERLSHILPYASEPYDGRPIAMNNSLGNTLAGDLTVQKIFAAIGARAAICVPLARSGRVAAMLYLAQDTPRNWAEEEKLLARDVAERIRAAVQRGRVEQEKNRAEELLWEGMLAARMIVWEKEIASDSVTLSRNAPLILGCSANKMTEIWKSLHPDDAERLRAVHARAIERESGYREMVRFTRPDTRQTIWIEIHAKVRYDASGKPFVVRGVMVDVSERMRVQSELALVNQTLMDKLAQLENARARQAFQLRIADALREIAEPEMILSKTCRLLGEYLRASRVLCGDYDIENKQVTFHSNYTDGTVAEINGTYPAAALGTDNFSSLGDGKAWVSADMARDSRTGREDIWPAFAALGIASGVVVPLSRRGSLMACLFVNANKARKWSGDEIELIQDVAQRAWNAVERTRAEEALRQADRRKDQFLAMLAHELRNPLAPVSSAAQLLKHAGLDPVRVRNISDIIARQVSHMTGLINDLLDVSRVTRGLIVLNKDEVDMKGVVADAVEQVRPLTDARRHEFTVQPVTESLRVFGDHKRLVQVLANLLSNAAKYTPSEGRIQVAMEADREQVTLRVTDNGIGMPAELMPNVFELFAQGARTPDRSQGGLGLGLTLVKSLVELHDGKVRAESNGPGTGSTFIVELPRMLSQGSEADLHEGSEEPVADAPEPLRLIVVDDNVDAAEALAMLLELSGYRVATEHDPLKALERARQERFDACLLDIGLPGMDGNELARRLRTIPNTMHALLIAITGYGQHYDRQRSMAAGFDEYFVKPVDPVKLIGVVRELCAQQSCGHQSGCKPGEPGE